MHTPDSQPSSNQSRLSGDRGGKDRALKSAPLQSSLCSVWLHTIPKLRLMYQLLINNNFHFSDTIHNSLYHLRHLRCCWFCYCYLRLLTRTNVIPTSKTMKLYKSVAKVGCSVKPTRQCIELPRCWLTVLCVDHMLLTTPLIPHRFPAPAGALASSALNRSSNSFTLTPSI